MPCSPCEEKKKAREAKETAAAAESAAPETPTVDVSITHLAIYCVCGLTRMIPTGLKIGDIFTLVPCIKCGNAFKGRFVGNGVEQI